MICKNNPSEGEILTCKTCVTPWHVNCLCTPPETLSSTLQWDCPDCSPITGDLNQIAGQSALSGVSAASGDLITAIRAIEADQSLTEQEKARKRQKLMSGATDSPDQDEEMADKNGKKKSNENDVLDLFDENLLCIFCMQMPERPVTTPCGHNFCLKCFQRWVGQGKRTCAKCREIIPPKMASQPRINSSMVIAIRLAKASKNVGSRGPSNVYHYQQNNDRPDKAFTTDRAKKTGKANACSGRIFITVAPDHFGPILAENDPRNQGVLVGESWEDRMECRQWGTHRPHVAGIAGQSDYGAQSVALSGGYVDDEDHGEWFLYTGSGGRDLSGNKRTNKDQSKDQVFDKMNEALRLSCKKGYPVRVVRSHKEKRSCYAPETGVRYDGIYRIEKCWRKVGVQGFKVCRYLFVRCDNEPAPWTSDEHGDRPRPLPIIKELSGATDITERKGTPSWDYDEVEAVWKWKKPPPMSRIPVETGNEEDNKKARKASRQAKNMSVHEKLLKEFSCLLCRKVMTLPLTTPCAHNFCKPCLEGAFAGKTFLRERSCQGRSLRTQKTVMKCPSCPNDISDFLKNPQVNRELMGVIESLKRKTEENNEEPEDMECSEVEGDNSKMLEDENKALVKPQSDYSKPKEMETECSDFSGSLDGAEKNEESAEDKKKLEVAHGGTEATIVNAAVAETTKSLEIPTAKFKLNRGTKRKIANGEDCPPKAEVAVEGNDSPSSPLIVRSEDSFE